MIQEITTTDDVRTFFNQLLEESLNFHPDEDFANYINAESEESTYSLEEAETRNSLMDRAFEICALNEVCIYEIAHDLSLKYTGLDKFFGIEM